MYTIIEDSSPYYIRFTFTGLNHVLNFVSNQVPINIKNYLGYSHDTLDIKTSEQIISMLPMSTQIDFKKDRVAIFTTMSGGGSGIHKDGLNNRLSINLHLHILDDKCTTYWYEDKLFENLTLVGDTNYTRNVYPDYKTMNKFQSIKTMVAQPNEMVLFNTDIYHSWSNLNSKNYRKILTLRPQNSGTFYFDDAKKLLFNL